MILVHRVELMVSDQGQQLINLMLHEAHYLLRFYIFWQGKYASECMTQSAIKFALFCLFGHITQEIHFEELD